MVISLLLEQLRKNFDVMIFKLCLTIIDVQLIGIQ